MSEQDSLHELRAYLGGQGYTEDQIAQIIVKLYDYEMHTQVDSIMDSIAGGQSSLQKIIDEALKSE